MRMWVMILIILAAMKGMDGEEWRQGQDGNGWWWAEVECTRRWGMPDSWHWDGDRSDKKMESWEHFITLRAKRPHDSLNRGNHSDSSLLLLKGSWDVQESVQLPEILLIFGEIFCIRWPKRLLVDQHSELWTNSSSWKISCVTYFIFNLRYTPSKWISSHVPENWIREKVRSLGRLDMQAMGRKGVKKSPFDP